MYAILFWKGTDVPCAVAKGAQKENLCRVYMC